MKIWVTAAAILLIGVIKAYPTKGHAALLFNIEDKVEQTEFLRGSPNIAKEVALWLMDIAHRSDHYHTKRNSEIINSLLGLPKVLNDAGR